MWLGVQPHHSRAVSPDEPFTAMPTHRAGRPLSVTGDKLLIDSRAVVPELTDENVQFAEILIFWASSLHPIGALVLQLDLA
jgi:hypothetical protein